MVLTHEERREFARTQLNMSKRLEIVKALEVGIQDISLGGVRFESNQRFAVGSEISLGNSLFRTFATVLECRHREDSKTVEAPRYTVRCQFHTTEDQAQEKMLTDLMTGAERSTPQFQVFL